jgi:hypothetical protein
MTGAKVPMRMFTSLLLPVQKNRHRVEDSALNFSEDIDNLDSISAVGVILR